MVGRRAASATTSATSAAAVSEQLLLALTRLERLLNARASTPASPSGWALRGAVKPREGKEKKDEEEDEDECEDEFEFSSGDEGGSIPLAGRSSRQDAFQSASPREMRRRLQEPPGGDDDDSASNSSSEGDVVRAIKGQLKALCGLDDA